MTRFPSDFAELLTPRGLALAEGRHEAQGLLARQTFFTATDLLDPDASRAMPALLERVFGDVLSVNDSGVPDPKAGKVSQQDALPKVGRLLTGDLKNPVVDLSASKTAARARDSGLLAMLDSPSYRRLVEALCGHPASGPQVAQVFCYRPGDYAGPHTDNLPEYDETRGGYTDVHLTFCSPGVQQQLLVYQSGGHLSQISDLTGVGTITAYRLPFWHYTTPLVGAPGSRRWLLLGTFTHPGLPANTGK